MSYIGNEPIVSATRTITEITATAGQTVFVANGGYTVGYIDVFVNGAQLQTSDFTATNGSSITLGTGASSGDDIRLVAWGTFSAANTYTQSATDALLATKLNTSTNVAFKNRIINGDMRIDQRGASAVPTNAAYTLDRWQSLQSGGGAFSVQQSSVAPAGFSKSLLCTVTTTDASFGTSDYYFIDQLIEGNNISDLGWGSSVAKTVTVSFWVRSSVTGLYGGSLMNAGWNRSYPFSYTINVADTWEYKSVTITGDAAGTWLTTNGVGIRVIFGFAFGSNYVGTSGAWTASEKYTVSSSVNLLSTTGNTFYLTGVQLEVGSSATPFDTRAYGMEDILCKRYFLAYTVASTCTSWSVNSTQNLAIGYPVSMRATPTYKGIISGAWSGNTPAENYNCKDGYVWYHASYFYGAGSLVVGFDAEL